MDFNCPEPRLRWNKIRGEKRPWANHPSSPNCWDKWRHRPSFSPQIVSENGGRSLPQNGVIQKSKLYKRPSQNTYFRQLHMETYYVLNITKLRVFYNSAASCYRLHKPECTKKWRILTAQSVSV